MGDRLIDSIFPFGEESGVSTHGDLRCGLCGIEYNKGADEAEDYNNDSVAFIDFAGITVAECCFGKLEREILNNIPTILRWYQKILELREGNLNKDKALLESFRRC